jgi:hypothetical protein
MLDMEKDKMKCPNLISWIRCKIISFSPLTIINLCISEKERIMDRRHKR